MNKLNADLIALLTGEPEPGLARDLEDPLIPIFVWFTGEIEALTAAGFQPRLVTGDLASGDIPLSRIEALAALDSVRAIDGNRTYRPQLDESLPITHVPPVHDPPFNIKGAGVIVGIIDTGIDFRHEAFGKPGTPTRILRLWDQTITGPPLPGESRPRDETNAVFRTYGIEYTRDQILQAQASGSPAVPIRQQDTDGHGTHVAGIAAGDGSPGCCTSRFHNIGVAPEADLVIVKHTFNTAQLPDAFEYIIRQGRRFNRPVVVNMSLGSGGGPHDGTEPDEIQLQALLAANPNAVLVIATGNDAAKRLHAAGTGTLAVGASVNLDWNVPANDQSRDRIEIWYGGAARLDLTVTPPGGAAFAPPLLAGAGFRTLALPNTNRLFMFNRINANPVSNDHQIIIDVAPGAPGPGVANTIQTTNAANPWRATLTNNGTAPATWHAWISDFPRANGSPDAAVSFRDGVGYTVTANMTIGSPASMRGGAIAVASFISRGDNLGQIAPSSNNGPTRDARAADDRKPDISAPGQTIISAASADVPGTAKCCADKYVVKQGTSMAAPHVTGAVALLFSQNPAMTRVQVRDRLLTPALADANTGAVPNDVFGRGKLNVHGSILAPTRGLDDGPLGDAPAPIPGFRGPLPSAPLLSPFSAYEPSLEAFRQRPAGALLAGLVERHFDEAFALVNSQRRVATAWHRCGGPKLVQIGMGVLMRPEMETPTRIGDRDLRQSLNRFLALLAKYGSRDLCADISRYREWLLSQLGKPLEALQPP